MVSNLAYDIFLFLVPSYEQTVTHHNITPLQLLTKDFEPFLYIGVIRPVVHNFGNLFLKYILVKKELKNSG